MLPLGGVLLLQVVEEQYFGGGMRSTERIRQGLMETAKRWHSDTMLLSIGSLCIHMGRCFASGVTKLDHAMKCSSELGHGGVSGFLAKASLSGGSSEGGSAGWQSRHDRRPML
jgi:hypothetical protein